MQRRRAVGLGVLVAFAVGALAFIGRGPRATPPSPPPQATKSQPRNVLIIAPDTLRADRLSAMRDGRAVAPSMRSLATTGTTFSQMYSQAGWTLPALGSLLTGRYTLVPELAHQNSIDFLPIGARTLPTIFRAAGYRTAVFWGSSLSGLAAEFSTGFDHVATSDVGSEPAAAGAWIASTPGVPWFALIHDQDLQFVHAPPTAGGPAQWEGARPLDQAMRGVRGALPPDAAAEFARAAYDVEVSAFDTKIGSMLTDLRGTGNLTNTIVLLTSNHGIELGEHGGFEHGIPFDSNLHVPLVIVDPTHPAAAADVGTIVQTVDIAPTLLDLAGLAAEPGMVGQSLRPLLPNSSGTYTERPVFSVYTPGLISARTPSQKLVRREEQGRNTVYELYDLILDPAETSPRHLRPDAPDARALVTGLEDWWKARHAETDADHASQSTGEKLRKAMQEHGYWDADPKSR